MLCSVADLPDDDRRTVELAVRPPDPEEFAEEPRTVLDDTRAMADPQSGDAPAGGSAETPLTGLDAWTSGGPVELETSTT